MNSTPKAIKVAYFSMEIAIDPGIPTYAGGLGILAGDMLRSAADLEVPVVGVTLVHHNGYFRQRLDPQGNQSQEPDHWNPPDHLQLTEVRVAVTIEGRVINIQAWQFSIRGISGHVVPVYFLDAAMSSNSPWDQHLTDSLYADGEHYRLCQEVVLGIGGVAALDALGHSGVETYHMNEGHSALLALELLEQQMRKRGSDSPTDDDLQAVRRRCVFTTHTPVPAGQDKFAKALVRQVLGEERARYLETTGCCLDDGILNMTYLALRCSHYINGVAMHHGEISQGMFPNYPIRAITNGVHAVTWTSVPFRDLFDRHIPEWRRDNLYLRYAIGIPLEEIREAHMAAKRALVEAVKRSSGVQLDISQLIVGFARRAASYKRSDLLFSNIEKLKWIAEHVGPFQLLYGGKAHPQDEEGKTLIRRVFEAARSLSGKVPLIYIENYDIRWGQLFTSGVDVWLNTPHRPFEASGTSGMKAALNGVPSLSVLDGWWIEGCIEGVTGWAIGHQVDVEDQSLEMASLYDKLERIVLPTYYGRPSAFAEMMRSAIALNGSFFNTQRMVGQYESNAYFPEQLL